MEMRLEALILPVADVERAKDFYAGVGFDLDVDHEVNADFRVVQFTPPGSQCSIIFGTGLGETAQSPVKGMHLVVTDIEEAVADLTRRGVPARPIFHMTPGGTYDGVDPERTDYGSYSAFEDPDGNGWIIQERGYSPG
jgi:catechol 2,3-dioxygenase-like lactoylglutathione lyase family enzyme